MPLTVSLNGPDNVGKTSQLKLLPRDSTLAKIGGLHEYDKKLDEMRRNGSLQDWWWHSHNEEFVRTIFEALRSRYSSSSAVDSIISIFDRGTVMFEAVATSCIAIKSVDRDLNRARALLRTILEDNGLQAPAEELAILFKHGESLDDSVRITMSREEKPEDLRYMLYQQLLHQELQYQENRGLYHHIISVAAGSSVGEIQEKLRRVIFAHSQNAIFLPLMHPVNCIYAFSGLSESGKSSLATAFCEHFGVSKAFRTKIVYFNNIVSDRLGESVYKLPEKEQALNLLHELERFSRAHYWLRIITIESLHRHLATKWLKLWLEEKLQIVYVDTNDDKRLERALVPPRALTRNDDLKRERGVELIRWEADLVLDNNGSFVDSVSTLVAFANANSLKCSIDRNVIEEKSGEVLKE